MSDRGFVPATWAGAADPSGDAYELGLKALFTLRPNTLLVLHETPVPPLRWKIAISDFLEFLGDPMLAPIVGDLFIGVHGSSTNIQMPLTPQQTRPTDYSFLLSNAFSVTVPQRLHGKTLHFKGCEIGKHPEVLTAIKEALDGKLNIVAPKHYHAVRFLPAVGAFEYMCKEYLVQTEKQIGTREKLIDELTKVHTGAGMREVFEKWMPDPLPELGPRVSTRNGLVSLATPAGTLTEIKVTGGLWANLYRRDSWVRFANESEIPAPENRLVRLRDEFLSHSHNDNSVFPLPPDLIRGRPGMCERPPVSAVAGVSA